MKSLIPNSYNQLIEQASGYSNYPKPQIENLLKYFNIQGLRLHAQAPMFYIVDYTQQKYLFIDPSCKQVLGYDFEFLCNAGPLFFVNQWHKNDLKVFNENILTESLNFLRKQQPSSYADYSFSFNYRIKTKDGSYLTLLQRSTYYLSAANGTPLAAVGFAVDITHFKQDNNIIFTIEKVDRNFSSLSKTPLLKSVYYPDKNYSVFSRREAEILQLINKGMSSRQIAEKLYVSLHTINNHRKKMLEKSNAKNVAELISFALQNGAI